MRTKTLATVSCIFLSLIFVGGCKKAGNTPENSEAVVINTDVNALTQRISTDSIGVISMQSVSGSGVDNALGDSSNGYPMELVAEADAPTYQGNLLRATHVDINGNYAYVSYNTEGEKYLGGIDVFDISDVSAPKMVAEIIFPYRDISAVLYYNNKLYFAGASDVYKDTSLTTPAIAGYMELSNGIPTSNYKIINISGQVGTDLAIQNNKLYVTSGTQGGLTTIDLYSFKITSTKSMDDARSVAASSDKVAVYSGASGIFTYNLFSLWLLKNWSIGTDEADAKRTIDFNDDYLLVAAGKLGMLYYNSNTGIPVGSIALPTELPLNIDPAEVVTNAVSNNDGLFLIANGAAGLYVADETTAHGVEVVGNIDLDGSVNYVKSKGDYIYAATGKGGLKIIKLTRPSTATDCSTLPSYHGSAHLNVNSNDDLAYGGSVALQGVNVNGSLYYCGAMSVSGSCNINSNGVFEVHGSLACGKSSHGTSMIINSSGALNIEGDLVIYGNLVLNSGSSLNFLGTGSTITVYGTVTKNGNVAITGSYKDVLGKIH